MELQLMTIEPLVSSGQLRQLLGKSKDLHARKGIVQRLKQKKPSMSECTPGAVGKA